MVNLFRGLPGPSKGLGGYLLTNILPFRLDYRGNNFFYPVHSRSNGAVFSVISTTGSSYM